MKNKYFKLIYFLFAALCVLLSCTKQLADLNKNPNSYETITPEYLFTNSIISEMGLNPIGDEQTLMQALQQEATYLEVQGIGDKYFSEGSVRDRWSAYSGSLNQIQIVIKNLKNDPKSVNKLSVTRIWRVYIFHHLTDLYGDVPYSDANEGLENNYQPKYDLQADIYKDMFKELEESVNAFDESMPKFGSSDLFYGGNITQWKKFAYSLMLRLGMHLTKVDPELAKNWVQKAIAGGPILEDADIAKVPYLNGSLASNRNPMSVAFITTNYSSGQDPSNNNGAKHAKTFIDYLKGNSTTTKDPRLNVISVVWVKQPSGIYVADTSTSIQKGMQNGVFNILPPDWETYSEPNPNTILKYDAPKLVMTPAETYFLLAEAAIRGWYTGSAASSYANGVSAAMRQWALYDKSGVITDDQINYYLMNNPFKISGTFDEQLEQISTQKWVLFYLDQIENFSNWRRTGYPKLIPTNYPGNITGGQIPRRYIVPDEEEQLNTANFLEAKNRQSGNNTLLSRVWWDKE
jgi:hypothetical protein